MNINRYLPFFNEAIRDFRLNRFLHTITIITISFSVLIVSAFLLFVGNAGDFVDSWKKGIKLLVYLEKNVYGNKILDAKQRISGLDGVEKIIYLPKDQALLSLQTQMKRQSSLFDNLDENPLPDSFEVYIKNSDDGWNIVENLAKNIEAMDEIDSVEYGQKWIGKLTTINNIFRLTSFTMSCLFFMVTVFIIANTIRLSLYSRKDEIEVMYIIGATEQYIKTPFYIQGTLLGAIGGFFGIMILFIAYQIMSLNLESNLSDYMVTFNFLSLKMILVLLISSATVGWLGCYISLKQFLKIE